MKIDKEQVKQLVHDYIAEGELLNVNQNFTAEELGYVVDEYYDSVIYVLEKLNK